MCSLYPLYIRDEPSSWAHETPVLESPEHETANLDAINQSIRVSDKLNSLSVNGQAIPAAHATRPPEPVPLLCPLLFINIRAPCCSRHAPISSGHSRESRSARSTRKLPRSVCNFPISRLCPRGAPQSKPPNSTGSIGGALPVGCEAESATAGPESGRRKRAWWLSGSCGTQCEPGAVAGIP